MAQLLRAVLKLTEGMCNQLQKVSQPVGANRPSRDSWRDPGVNQSCRECWGGGQANYLQTNFPGGICLRAAATVSSSGFRHTPQDQTADGKLVPPEGDIHRPTQLC